jgi:hypothetical protein
MDLRLLASVLFVVLPVLSQSERGIITSVVRDPSGAAIGGAEVIAMLVATNVQTKTQTTVAGEYNIPVSPGAYTVTVTAVGFKRYERDHVIIVSTASTVRLDADLVLSVWCPNRVVGVHRSWAAGWEQVKASQSEEAKSAPGMPP